MVLASGLALVVRVCVCVVYARTSFPSGNEDYRRRCMQRIHLNSPAASKSHYLVVPRRVVLFHACLISVEDGAKAEMDVESQLAAD